MVIGAGDNKHNTQTKEDPRHPNKGISSRKMVQAVLEKRCPASPRKERKKKEGKQVGP